MEENDFDDLKLKAAKFILEFETKKKVIANKEHEQKQRQFIETKICSTCEKEKELSEFYIRTDTNKPQSSCKKCYRENYFNKDKKIKINKGETIFSNKDGNIKSLIWYEFEKQFCNGEKISYKKAHKLFSDFGYKGKHATKKYVAQYINFSREKGYTVNIFLHGSKSYFVIKPKIIKEEQTEKPDIGISPSDIPLTPKDDSVIDNPEKRRKFFGLK